MKSDQEPARGPEEQGGSIREVDAATVRAWQQAGECVLVDVREEAEYEVEHIEGVLLAPLSRLETTPLSLPDDKKAVFLCRSGNRTRVHALRLLRCAGRDVYALEGGMIAWKARGFPTEFD